MNLVKQSEKAVQIVVSARWSLVVKHMEFVTT
jgi:hypothetical protein